MGLGIGALAGSPRAHGTAPGALVAREPTVADWKALATQVEGSVQLPSSLVYGTSKLLFSTEFDRAKPAAVVQIRRQADVQHAVAFAARFGLQVSVRSGGHSYVGASAADRTIVLDQRGYNGIRYDAQTKRAEVWAGANLYAVHQSLAQHGRAIPTGTCPTVGVAGLTLGGGVGVDSRRYGLTCDRLVSATVVTAKGDVLIPTQTAHSELFWALRGGGGGANAVVASLTFTTHVAESRGIFSLTFPSAQAARVLTGWASWLTGTSTSRWANARIEASSGGQLRVGVLGVTTAGDEKAAMQSLLDTIGVAPTDSSLQILGYLDAVRHLGGGSNSKRQGFAAGSEVLTAVDTDTATKVVEAVAARARVGGTGVAILDPLDGAVAASGGGFNAFPWRDHSATVQWYTGVASPAGYASARSWIADAHRRLAPHSSGRYVNYLEKGVRPDSYFGPHTNLLRKVRRTYDPAHRIYCGLTL